MSENKTFLVMNAIVNKENMAELQDYLSSAMLVFGKNGGKPVGRFKTAEQLLGKDAPEMTAIIEFPDADTVKGMVKGEAFMALSEVRERVFSKLNMMICVGM